MDALNGIENHGQMKVNRRSSNLVGTPNEMQAGHRARSCIIHKPQTVLYRSISAVQSPAGTKCGHGAITRSGMQYTRPRDSKPDTQMDCRCHVRLCSRRTLRQLRVHTHQSTRSTEHCPFTFAFKAHEECFL